jgi:cytochrome c6
MGRIFTFCIAIVALFMFVTIGISGKAVSATPGEAGFKQNCAVCHPDGGNIINPKKTLHKKDLDANNVKNAEDIIKLMRKPGPGMTAFDANTVPDKDAKEIANYILTTFK